MMVGDPGKWADQFRPHDERFLQCVAEVWCQCLDLLPGQPVEDVITLNLKNVLIQGKARQLFHYIDYHFEPYGYTDSGQAYSKGQIDLAVILHRDSEDYLAYECKRLNVTDNSGHWTSLAGIYVTEGLKRFITEQYAEGLPVGCMLGYVMDGDVGTAKSKVWEAINNRKQSISLIAGPTKEQPVGTIRRFSSRHQRSASQQEIEIRHALLPFPKAKSKPTQKKPAVP